MLSRVQIVNLSHFRCVLLGDRRRWTLRRLDVWAKRAQRNWMADCFRAIVGSGEYERGKPAPDCFLLAARKLGAEPAECTVFEDSEAGVAAGKAAGMRVVALKLPDHPPQDLSAADLVLDDLSKFDPL